MTALELIREQMRGSHELMESTISGSREDILHSSNTKKALPVGAAYAHAVISEDVIVSGMLAKTTPLSADNSKTGLSSPMPSFAEWDKYEEWVKTVKIDLQRLQEFAKDVYESTDKYIGSLSNEDLTREVDTGGMGTHTIAHILSSFVIQHNASLAGEVSAAKGFQGEKGYPF